MEHANILFINQISNNVASSSKLKKVCHIITKSSIIAICDRICKNRSKSHKNWNPFYCWTLKLNSCTNQKPLRHGYIYIDGQVCFHRRPFASPVRPLRCTTLYRVFGGQWMALIRMWVAPDCCQRLSRLILWIESVSVTYWRHSTAVCVLMEVLTRLRLPTRPLHPPHITCHPWYYSHCEKAYSKIKLAVLAASINSYKTLAIKLL